MALANALFPSDQRTVSTGPLVIALGGNALIRPGDRGGFPQQAARVAELAPALAALAGNQGLVLTHGNGPQVGWQLLRSDLAQEHVPPEPIDAAVAATQGEIGILLQQAVGSVLAGGPDARPVVTLLTQVLVDPDDPAFNDPTKYIGTFYSQSEARRRASELGWKVKADGIRGWRRVVPSPHPTEVVEAPVIAALAGQGVVVIACGGGGVPVMRAHGRLVGVEAVVDKDRATALLAATLGAERMVILTAVDRVMVGFGTPAARPLDEVCAAEVAVHQAAGEFPAGSMGPKIEAGLWFLEHGGREVIITSPEQLPHLDSGGLATRIRS